VHREPIIKAAQTRQPAYLRVQSGTRRRFAAIIDPSTLQDSSPAIKRSKLAGWLRCQYCCNLHDMRNFVYLNRLMSVGAQEIIAMCEIVLK
jgi:hypothetical protein